MTDNNLPSKFKKKYSGLLSIIKDTDNVFELNKVLMQIQTHSMSLSDVAKIVKIYESRKKQIKK